jgi:hypothetical protein
VSKKRFEPAPPPSGELLIYESEDGRIRLDVRLEEESIWLTQPMMAQLFQTTQQNISRHILNIYKEGEPAAEATHKQFLSVRQEGTRKIQREFIRKATTEAFSAVRNQTAMRGADDEQS